MNIVQTLINRFKRKKTSGEISPLVAIVLEMMQAPTEKAKKAEEQQNWQEAIEAWSEVITLAEVMEGEVLATVLDRRGVIFLRMNRFQEAHNDIDRALSIEPKNASFWSSKAVAFTAEGKSEEAIKAAKRAIEFDPNEPEALLVLKYGGVNFNQLSVHHLQEVARELTEEDNLVPRSLSEIVVARKKAEQAGQEGRWQDAIKLWTFFLQKASTDPNMTDEARVGALYERAIAYLSQKRYEQALKDLETALSLLPDHASLWSAKASVYLMQGNKEGAFEAANRSITFDPDDELAKNLLAKLVESGYSNESQN